MPSAADVHHEPEEVPQRRRGACADTRSLARERKARPSPTRARAHRLLCAQKYILDGCEGDFKDTMVSMSAATEETSRTSSSAVSTSLLLTLSGSCGVAALLIGFVAGAREERQIGYRSPVV